MPKLEILKQRLLTKTIISESGCWEWEGAVDSWGYGTISFDGRQIGVHRASWLIHNGPINNGLHVLHSCDNRCCWYPGHLFLGTHQDNMKDRNAKGRHYPGLTKLTESEVREIKRLLQTTNRTMQDIGHQFGMSKYAISDISRGRTWSHVE